VLILACACLLRFGRISARKTISIDDALWLDVDVDQLFIMYGLWLTKRQISF